MATLLGTPSLVHAQSPEQVSAVANALEWREIGPTIVGGRVSDLAVVEQNPATFYVATATGGVWKTENMGVTFSPVFDDQETSSIGDVTVAPSKSNPNVVWVGTGEPQNRQSSPWGNGVYRSTDAGRSWSHLGLSETHHISRIAVHPRDPDVAYVAAVGRLWGASPERGVYKTSDGGVSWNLVLHVDEHTGAIDLAMDPNDPRTLFAAMYQRQRRAWGFNGGGPGSGIYRTTNGGDSWMEPTGATAGWSSRRAFPLETRVESGSTSSDATEASCVRSSRPTSGCRGRASGLGPTTPKTGSTARRTAARRGSIGPRRTTGRCTTR